MKNEKIYCVLIKKKINILFTSNSNKIHVNNK